MIKKFILLLVFLGTQLLIWAQRPLSIEVLRPKVDSVKELAKQLSTQLRIVETLEQIADQRDLEVLNHLVYRNKQSDTLIGLLLDSANKIVLECHFNNSDSIALYCSSKGRSISKKERNHQNAVLAFKEEILKPKYEITLPDYAFLEYLMFTDFNTHRFHLLNLPKKDSIIPLGNDYIFSYTQDAKLSYWEKIGKAYKISIKKEDNVNENIEAIWLQKGPSAAVPPAEDLLKLRKYYRNIRLDKYIFLCNKREFNYQADKNEISIKLFPIETR